MSKIKELLNDSESVLVFDVDGVLATLEFSLYNHFYGKTDDEWIEVNKSGINFYTEDKVSNKIKSFLKNKDMNRVYVITKIGFALEGEYKKQFANKYYNIPIENVYIIDKNTDKTESLRKIKNKYPELQDRKTIMIDDTVKNLNEVMEKTEFSTAHISSFLDI